MIKSVSSARKVVLGRGGKFTRDDAYRTIAGDGDIASRIFFPVGIEAYDTYHQYALRQRSMKDGEWEHERETVLERHGEEEG